MAFGFRKAWLWGKLILIILVVAWVTLFLAKNSDNNAHVWLFPWVNELQSVPLSLIIPITAVAAVVVFFLVRKVANVLQQMNQLREEERALDRERRMEELTREMEKKLSTQALQTQEPEQRNEPGT